MPTDIIRRRVFEAVSIVRPLLGKSTRFIGFCIGNSERFMPEPMEDRITNAFSFAIEKVVVSLVFVKILQNEHELL